MATRADLQIYQGDDWSGEVSVEDTDGAIADLSGYTAKAQIRNGPADSGTVLCEIACIVQSSVVLLSLPKEDTVLLRTPQLMPTNMVWDLQVASPTGFTSTLLSGYVRVSPEVTR